MSSQTIGLIIGGVLPALFFGVSGVFSKASNAANGIGLGYYLVAVGLAIALVGAISFLFIPDRSLTYPAGRDAILTGASWALGAACVAIALSRYQMPISKLVPLYNMNTLVAVLLGLWLFSEWQDINLIKLIIGSILVVLGGMLVAWA